MNNNENASIVQGNVTISENVIANIARLATEEIDGVCKTVKTVTETFTDIFSNKQSQGVKVNIAEDKINLEIAIELIYGVDIESTCREIQKNVKNSVESMTNLEVEYVNVLVSSLNTDSNFKEKVNA
ncbi:Asp23/Gls24 family envelope stress response protein [uncultured Ezakiella sp.]|uniref:Asp23/Gls24 family envelope stress response protein n=1 Tax=uncultured Ezakiella sp. TaxID=1637529 RepID=UPI0025DFE31B|nr:Asp23/Gls24 family envelope stress response protein [uncultured Ezakiella sp.]